MKRNTRAQSKRNVVPETSVSLPSNLPVPSTSRNLVPRSRAASLARSISRSLSRSRGSSRRSSISASRLGDSKAILESKLSDSRPPTPGGTISENNVPADIAYSSRDRQIPGPSDADAVVEKPSNNSQSQESSSDSTSQQSPSRNMIPSYPFNGNYPEQSESSRDVENGFQENTDYTWFQNYNDDDVPQQPFLPSNSGDAFTMQQNFSFQASQNRVTEQDYYIQPPEQIAGSSYTQSSSSNVPYFQNFAPSGSGGPNNYLARDHSSLQYQTSTPSYDYANSYSHRGAGHNGLYVEEQIPPVPPSPQGSHNPYFRNITMNDRWRPQPTSSFPFTDTFQPYNDQTPVNAVESTNDQQLMLPTVPSADPHPESATYQQRPSLADSLEPLTDIYETNFLSSTQWHPEPSQRIGNLAHASSGQKRKRSLEDESHSHEYSARPNLHYGDGPSLQESGRIDSDSEVAEQLLYSSNTNAHLDGSPVTNLSQDNPPIDRKGKGKARAQTADREEVLISHNTSSLERLTPSMVAAADYNGVNTEKRETIQQSPADPLSSYTCPICFSPPTNASITPCGHICCGACLFAAVKTTMQRSTFGMARSPMSEARCPVCRATIPGWDGKGGGVIGLKVRAIFSL